MKKLKRILLVDDDADDQHYFLEVLKEINPTLICEIAINGYKTLEQLSDPPPDLIFIDLNMPFMNGYESLAELKKKDKYKNIPVVIFTTSTNSYDIERTKSLGTNLFFAKPSNFSVLCAKLKKSLSPDFSNSQSSINLHVNHNGDTAQYSKEESIPVYRNRKN